jgi:hypothetical protein
MTKRYTVSDGKLMLYLSPAEEGGYNVTSPLDPALITQAETVEEAFEMAYDAQKSLRLARAKRARQTSGVPATMRPSKRANATRLVQKSRVGVGNARSASAVNAEASERQGTSSAGSEQRGTDE